MPPSVLSAHLIVALAGVLCYVQRPVFLLQPAMPWQVNPDCAASILTALLLLFASGSSCVGCHVLCCVCAELGLEMANLNEEGSRRPTARSSAAASVASSAEGGRVPVAALARPSSASSAAVAAIPVAVLARDSTSGSAAGTGAGAASPSSRASAAELAVLPKPPVPPKPAAKPAAAAAAAAAEERYAVCCLLHHGLGSRGINLAHVESLVFVVCSPSTAITSDADEGESD